MLRQIFKEIKQYRGVTAKAISQRTGISENHISEYLNGKRDITSERLWIMIDAIEQLSPGAKADFGRRIAGVSFSPDELIKSLDPSQLGALLISAGARLCEKRDLDMLVS